MGRAGRATTLILVAALLGPPGCSGQPPPPPGTRRVVVVGVDGATWAVMSPLLASGRLPRIAMLYRSGSAGVMKAVPPLTPAALWTTIATGQPPARHGITRETVKAPGRYGVRPMTADRRAAPAVWTIAGARGLTVGVTGWAVTFPAEEVNGFMLTDALDPQAEPARAEIFPEGALGEAGKDVETYPVPEAARQAASLDAGLEAAFAEDLAMLSRGLSLYRVYQPHLALFRVRSVGYASHRFWQYHDPSYLQVARARGEVVDPERAARLAEAVPGAYAFLDGYLEVLMEHLPEGATLVIVSDHGFRGVTMTDYVHVDLDRLAERLGLLSYGPGGQPEWDRTTVFAPLDPEDTPRGLYLNVEGREAEGIVAPRDAQRTAEQVSQRLSALVTDRGQPLLSGVAPAGPRLPEGGPDIVVSENASIDPAASINLAGESVKVISLYRRDNESFGAHDPAGIALAAGGGIAVGSTGWEAAPEDLVPTLLALLGLPQAEDLPGRPIRPLLLDPDAPDDAGTVPSWQDLPAAPPPVLRPDPLIKRDLRRLREADHLAEGVRAP